MSRIEQLEAGMRDAPTQRLGVFHRTPDIVVAVADQGRNLDLGKQLGNDIVIAPFRDDAAVVVSSPSHGTRFAPETPVSALLR